MARSSRAPSLKGAQLQGASLNYAHLQGASLTDAHLGGAAQLQGTSLYDAQLQGAWLDHAQLQGASLDHAQLRGASLDHAQLQGASLHSAQLQGVLLDGAQLQGASLDGAQLQGASLDHAQLQGASLDHAQVEGASFVDACVWRANARQAVWKDTKVELPKGHKIHECDWTATDFAGLKKLIAEEVPEGLMKRDAMKRIEQRLDPTKALEREDEMAKTWAARASEAPAPEAYAKSLAGQWREAGCAAEGAPDMLHGLISRLSNPLSSPFRDRSDAAKALVSAFLDEAHCPAAHGLSEFDKATLKKIAAPTAPPAPKP
jgi:uncharacterized protein YjbI with pentapeptide repeats